MIAIKLAKLLDKVEALQRSGVHLIQDKEIVPVSHNLTKYLYNNYVNLRGPSYSNHFRAMTFGPEDIAYGFGRGREWRIVPSLQEIDKYFISETCNGTTTNTFHDSIEPLLAHLEENINKRKTTKYSDKVYEYRHQHSDGLVSELEGHLFMWHGGKASCEVKLSQEEYTKNGKYHCGNETNIILQRSLKKGWDRERFNRLRFICEGCAKDKKRISDLLAWG